jgi:hypothetical protein
MFLCMGNGRRFALHKICVEWELGWVFVNKIYLLASQ